MTRRIQRSCRLLLKRSTTSEESDDAGDNSEHAADPANESDAASLAPAGQPDAHRPLNRGLASWAAKVS